MRQHSLTSHELIHGCVDTAKPLGLLIRALALEVRVPLGCTATDSRFTAIQNCLIPLDCSQIDAK